jgi:hypothetical protein
MDRGLKRCLLRSRAVDWPRLAAHLHSAGIAHMSRNQEGHDPVQGYVSEIDVEVLQRDRIRLRRVGRPRGRQHQHAIAYFDLIEDKCLRRFGQARCEHILRNYRSRVRRAANRGEVPRPRVGPHKVHAWLLQSQRGHVQLVRKQQRLQAHADPQGLALQKPSRAECRIVRDRQIFGAQSAS